MCNRDLEDKESDRFVIWFFFIGISLTLFGIFFMAYQVDSKREELLSVNQSVTENILIRAFKRPNTSEYIMANIHAFYSVPIYQLEGEISVAALHSPITLDKCIVIVRNLLNTVYSSNVYAQGDNFNLLSLRACSTSRYL